MPHRKTSPGPAVEIALTGDGAVEDGVADDDVLARDDRSVGGRLNDDSPSGQPLADVVVGVTFEFQSHAPGQPRPEALTGRSHQPDVDGVNVEAFVAGAAGERAPAHIGA